MKQYLFSRRLFGLGIVLAGLGLVPATAASAATVSCPEPSLSQPFLAMGDRGDYTLAPGEAAGDFYGGGWTLSGGATIQTTTLADGTAGQVLSLPAGSRAVSPAMCVSAGYPLARMMSRTLGSAPTNATKFFVSRVGSSTLGSGMPVLGTPSWAASPPVNIAPGASGAEQVTYTFVAPAKGATIQVYDLYVDPRMSH